MIFLTTGSRGFPFDRLVRAMDLAAPQLGLSRTEVFAQTGSSAYRPVNISNAAFLDRADFERHMERCDILVTHAAAGAMISGLRKRKKIIAVSRLSSYGESIDDHQAELAEVLSKQNLLVHLKELDKLADTIRAIAHHEFDAYACSPERIAALIEARL